jgi:hypothetical protein
VAGETHWATLREARPELLAGVTVADRAVDFDWDAPAVSPEQVDGPARATCWQLADNLLTSCQQVASKLPADVSTGKLPAAVCQKEPRSGRPRQVMPAFGSSDEHKARRVRARARSSVPARTRT